MRELNVVLPGLIWHEVADYEYLYKQLNVPTLTWLLSKAKYQEFVASYSDFVYNFSADETLARFYARENDFCEFDNYLIVEPTHLRADRDRLLIAESEILQLNEEESREIISAVNQHFAGEIGLKLIKEDLWLLGTNLDLSDLVSYPIIDIIGENIDDYLPLGKSRMMLHKLMNEIQMLLFDHPVNKLRAEDGLIAVNSLWLWDKLKANSVFKTNRVLSNNSSIGDKIINLPEQLRQYDTLIIDKLHYPAQYRDSFAWVQGLHEIEQNLVPLLMDGTKTGYWQKLHIWVPNLGRTHRFTVSKLEMYKFWQNKTFEQISTVVSQEV